jgi:periplasmic mercuric ion binding protein
LRLREETPMRISASTFAALAAILSVCPALAGEKTVTLNVDNMYCASCAPVVKKSLARVEGVTKVEVSRETNTATVTFEDTKATVAALIEAATNAGYPSRLAK